MPRVPSITVCGGVLKSGKTRQHRNQIEKKQHKNWWRLSTQKWNSVSTGNHRAENLKYGTRRLRWCLSLLDIWESKTKYQHFPPEYNQILTT